MLWCAEFGVDFRRLFWTSRTLSRVENRRPQDAHSRRRQMPDGKPRLSVTLERNSPQCGHAIFGVVIHAIRRWVETPNSLQAVHSSAAFPPAPIDKTPHGSGPRATRIAWRSVSVDHADRCVRGDAIGSTDPRCVVSYGGCSGQEAFDKFDHFLARHTLSAEPRDFTHILSAGGFGLLDVLPQRK